MHEDPTTKSLPAAGGWLLGGRYRVLDRLGSGGMAEVFRAHDELLDRDVAVKVFRTAVDDADTQGEQRRELELQSLAHLNHPNLITLYDASLSGDGPGYLVLELVEGPDLATRLHGGPLPEPEVRQLGAQIADALAYVHARGLVHRDVKPANILLGSDGGPGTVRARLSDFGIVRMIGSARMTAVDLTLGTASYVAPEQARGANVGPAADVYALGLVLIEALTGSRCFDGPIHEALAARLTTAPHVPSSLPAPWPALLTAMTAGDPAARPPASAVSSALSGATPAEWHDVPRHSTLVAPLAAPEEPRRRRGPLLAAAAIACAAIVAGAGFLLAHQAETPGSGTITHPPTHARTRSVSSTHHTPATQAARVTPTHRATTPKAKHTPPGHAKHPAEHPASTPTQTPTQTPTTSAASTPAPASNSPPATGVAAP